MKRDTFPIAGSLRAFALLAVASCDSALTAPPEIAKAPDEKGTDVVLWIASHEVQADGGQLLAARGKLGERQVGFDLLLGPWRENPPGFINMSTWESAAKLRSSGAPSNEWVRYLADLYGTGKSSGSMVDQVEVNAFSPWKNPGDLEEGIAKFLLLFPATPMVDHPPEIRLEIDIENRRIVWKEKDPRLRGVLMEALILPEVQ